MTTNDTSRAQGFTLIELLIVVTIVLALASIVTPSFFSMTDESKIVVANTTLKNIQKKIRAHYELNGAWPEEIETS